MAGCIGRPGTGTATKCCIAIQLAMPLQIRITSPGGRKDRGARGQRYVLILEKLRSLLPQEAVAFAVMHHLSNMVRYRPEQVERLLVSAGHGCSERGCHVYGGESDFRRARRPPRRAGCSTCDRSLVQGTSALREKQKRPLPAGWSTAT